MASFSFNPETDKLTFLDTSDYDRKNLSPEDQIVMQPIHYFENTFNYSDIPKKLLMALNYWIGAPDDKVEDHLEECKMSVIGCLILQDLCEDKKLRQSKPTAHEVYGVPHTINAILQVSPTLVFATTAFKQGTLLVQYMENYSTNRELHIELADRAIYPSEELYYEICGNRGMLFQIVEHVLFFQKLYETNEIDVRKLVRKIQIFLTVVDECRRVAVNNTGDIEAVHFSFPVMYVINTSETDGELLLDILRQRSQEEVVLKHAISILKRSGCFDYARKQLRSIRREILEEVNKLERNLLMDEFINDYLDIPVNFEDIAWEIS